MERGIETEEAKYVSLYSSDYMGQSFDTTAALRETSKENVAKVSGQDQVPGARGQ